MKTPVVNREYYIIYLEVFNNMYWLHTDVFKWTSKIKKSFIIDLDVLQDLVDSPLYGLVEQDNKKLSKFGESIGFCYIKDLKGNDDNVYKIYSRSL